MGLNIFRSNCLEVFGKKGVFKNLSRQMSLKKAATQTLSCEYCKIAKKAFFTEHLHAIVSGFCLGN